jgi:hypothetical protein
VHFADIPDPSDSTPENVTTGTGSSGYSDDYSRGDHVHGGSPAASNANPNSVGRENDKAAGTSADFSRRDHIHGLPLAATDSQLGYGGLTFIQQQEVWKLTALISEPLGIDGSTGAIILNVGEGLNVDNGALLVTHGDGLKIDNDQLQAEVGYGLQFDGNAIVPRLGDGLTISGGAIVVKLDANSSLDYGSEGGLKVVPGSALYSFAYRDENNDVKYVHLDSNRLIVAYGESSAP